MLLVGVTINVALNGGLFEKAEYASEQMQIEAEKEELLSAVMGAIGNDGKIKFGDIKLPEGWDVVADRTYKSPKDNIYEVDANGKITEGDNANVTPTDNLAVLKAELENKSLEEVFNLELGRFNNTDIIFKELSSYEGDDIYPENYILVQYKEENFILHFNESIRNIILVDRVVIDSDNYFTVISKNGKLMITGLTENGIADLEATKKIIIPKTILGTDGKKYAISEIGATAFEDNTNLEILEFENDIQLEKIGREAFKTCVNLSAVSFPNSLKTIGESAFSGCDNLAQVNLNQGLITIGVYAFRGTQKLTSITIPESVTNIGAYAFNPENSQLTINLEGRTEEPATTDDYSGTGFENSWRGNGENITVVCLGN